MWEIVQADVMDWAANYTGLPFHAMLVDPPYELSFMSRKWDSTGIAFRPETWSALAEHLLPGAFILAFASSRGWHRLACAMEDAGMVLQPSIFVNGLERDVPFCLGWANSQSFPKSTRLDKKLDEMAGKEGKIIGKRVYADGTTAHMNKCGGHEGWDRPWMDGPEEDKGALWDTEPATPLARVWQGHRYGGQVLRDALTPIIVCQKPWAGKRLDCIVRTGAGTINVDGGRIGPATDSQRPQTTFCHTKEKTGIVTGTRGQGRWPQNLILIHSPFCQREGERRMKGSNHPGGGTGGIWSDVSNRPVSPGYADADGLETVATWRCLIACPECGYTWLAVDKEVCPECKAMGEWQCAVRRLGANTVDKPVFLSYNKEKQEVKECCENASIAVLNSMLDHTMSSEASGGSAKENVASPTDASAERLTLGDNFSSGMDDGIDTGESQEIEKFTDSLKADGSGKWQTGQSRKSTTYTTLTETLRTMTCPTCNASLLLYITLCTSDGEKITELSQTERKPGAASTAKSTNHSINSISVQREHIVATAKIAVENTCENGKRKMPNIPANTCGSGGIKTGSVTENSHAYHITDARPEKNQVSRYFFQVDWNYEIAERLATADPVHYCPKSSRRERDAGLDNFKLHDMDNAERYTMSGPMPYNYTAEDGIGKSQPRRNVHPCCKPLSLTRYLSTLLLPPPEYAPRRILIPFFGVSSEGIGALLAGFEEIVGIEMDAKYCTIGEARMKYWASRPEQMKLF